MSKIHIELDIIEKNCLLRQLTDYNDFLKFLEEGRRKELGLTETEEVLVVKQVKNIRNIFHNLYRDYTIYTKDISALECHCDELSEEIINSKTKNVDELLDCNILIQILNKIHKEVLKGE